jgi:nitric oxide reductase NorE protein
MTSVKGAGSPPQEAARGLDKHARFIPGQPDMWAFVFFETLVFTSYWVVYLLFRTGRPEAFLASQADLDLRVGVFNTIVLLASSWSVARCVQASREGRYRSALTNAFLTMSLGAVFLISKVLEWTHMLQLGNGFATSEFFQHYFFLTAIHALHVVIGFVVLGVVIYQLWNPARRSQELVETGATYWHTVDFLWVMIFALLYVVR